MEQQNQQPSQENTEIKTRNKGSDIKVFTRRLTLVLFIVNNIVLLSSILPAKPSISRFTIVYTLGNLALYTFEFLIFPLCMILIGSLIMIFEHPRRSITKRVLTSGWWLFLKIGTIFLTAFLLELVMLMTLGWLEW